MNWRDSVQLLDSSALKTTPLSRMSLITESQRGEAYVSEIKVQNRVVDKNLVIIEIAGEANRDNAATLINVINQAFNSEFSIIAVDFSKTEYLCIEGLGALVCAHKRRLAEASHRQVYFCILKENLPVSIRKRLNVTGLYRIIDIVEYRDLLSRRASLDQS